VLPWTCRHTLRSCSVFAGHARQRGNRTTSWTWKRASVSRRVISMIWPSVVVIDVALALDEMMHAPRACCRASSAGRVVWLESVAMNGNLARRSPGFRSQVTFMDGGPDEAPLLLSQRVPPVKKKPRRVGVSTAGAKSLSGQITGSTAWPVSRTRSRPAVTANTQLRPNR